MAGGIEFHYVRFGIRMRRLRESGTRQKRARFEDRLWQHVGVPHSQEPNDFAIHRSNPRNTRVSATADTHPCCLGCRV